jgi:DHA2 family multidrug resistance protein
MLNQAINTQSSIIGYLDDYKLMVMTSLPALLLLFLMRKPPTSAKPVAHEVMD